MRRLAGQHLIEHTAEGVDVGASIDVGIAGGLFRAHVVRRAECEAGLGDPLAGCDGEGARDAEVGDDGLSAGEHDVAWLDVAVDHAERMGVAEGGGDIAGDAQGVLDGEGSLAGEPIVERLAHKERHDKEEEVAAAGCARVEGDGAAVEERHDVGVLQPGGNADLGEEAVSADGGG